MKQRSAGKPDIKMAKQSGLRRVGHWIASASGIHPKDLKAYQYPQFDHKEFQVRTIINYNL